MKRTEPLDEPDAMELDQDKMAMLATIMAILQESPIQVESPDEPANLHKALDGPHATEWLEAYNDEFKSIKDMEVYELILRSNVPKGRKVM